MTKWTTYMGITLNTNGATPVEVNNKLVEMGWTPVYGDYDYKHEWATENWGNKGKDINEFITHVTNLHNTLKGMDICYCVRTYKEGTYTPTTVEKFE